MRYLLYIQHCTVDTAKVFGLWGRGFGSGGPRELRHALSGSGSLELTLARVAGLPELPPLDDYLPSQRRRLVGLLYAE